MSAEMAIWIGFGAGGLAIVTLLGIFFRKKIKKKSLPRRTPLTLGLEKTRRGLKAGLGQLLQQSSQIDSQILIQLEEILIGADVGVSTTQKLLQGLQQDVRTEGHREIHFLKDYLGKEMVKILQSSPEKITSPAKPLVMMIMGINGVGKTTTIAKLAHQFRQEGQQVLLAAADTFRAGAVDQLKIWGERVGATTLSQKEGADPAAVAFDAVKAGIARGTDRVLIDTAGRLHTKVNLMEEIKKVKRVIDKAMPGAPHEVVLVIDASQGQNVLQQARQFHEALGLTHLILTKLDGTSKGGIVVGIVDELRVPISYVGVGEGLEDLQPFDAGEFVNALLL